MGKQVKLNWNILFILFLIIGGISYLVIDYIETRPYEGEAVTITGKVSKSVYVSRGTVTGKSFTRITLDDGRTFRMPLGEMVILKKGDVVNLKIPKGDGEKSESDVQVIEYDLVEKSASAAMTDDFFLRSQGVLYGPPRIAR